MGETSKIIVEHVRVEELPAALRQGLESGILVRVTVEAEMAPRSRSLMTFMGAGSGVYTEEEAVSAIRALRDE